MPTTVRPPLRGDEADLFSRHHDALVRSVRQLINGPAALVEDACQIAWRRFLEHQPERGRGLFAWLRTVAVREAWELSERELRAARLDVTIEAGTLGDLLPDERVCLERALEARAALERVAELAPRQRRLFALQLAGFSYAETSAITGDSLRTVDRQLRRAHAQVRR